MIKKEETQAINFIKTKYGTRGPVPEMLLISVRDIAALMVEFAKPYKDELKELNKMLDSPEELGEYLAGI